MSTEPKIDVDLQTLLVKQVSALVEAPAEALHGNSDEQIRTMALLYRVFVIRAHQPGSEPIDIPETIPNPVVVPKPTPTPSEPAPKEPVRIPEKVPQSVAEIHFSEAMSEGPKEFRDIRNNRVKIKADQKG